jgi:DNA-binding transcriptional MerR regulator
MSHKQTSLFDFDEPSPQKDEVKLLPVQEEDELCLLKEENIETTLVYDAEITAETELPKQPKRGRRKITEVYITADLIDVPEDEILFQKKYYSIGKVAEMFKVNISLIRFWEKEFDILKPKLNGKGDRHFRPEDVKNLKLIHHLLREKKYTIEGANDFLKKNKKTDEVFAVIEELQRTKLFLIDLKLCL